ncbi:hypothetical protein [Streptomyces sp. NPDC051776]|uniref:hypothetical protein n=1 Tax=Streptomyces sp. NPDC051776 TaxID=3155414 RepID=UPI0034169617
MEPTMMTAMEPGPPVPEPGDYVKDTLRDRSAIVVLSTSRYVQLQPIAGGKPWDAKPDDVRRLTAREELSVRLAWRNAAHRWGK